MFAGNISQSALANEQYTADLTKFLGTGDSVALVTWSSAPSGLQITSSTPPFNGNAVGLWVSGGLPGQYQINGMAHTANGGQIPIEFNVLITPGVFLLPKVTVATVGLPKTVDSLVGFGDSIMFGQGADTTAQQWIQIFGAALGATVLQKGISGTVLQNSPDSSGLPRAQNGRDRFATDLLGSNKRTMVVIDYGFNDLRYTGAPSTFNVTQYTNDLHEVLNGLILGGYTASNIVLGTPYYLSTAGYSSGSTGFTGSTPAIHAAYDAAVTAIAQEYGVYFFDIDSYMAAHGGDALAGPDNIHPTNTGHAVIAAGMLQARRQISPAALSGITASSPTNQQLTVSFTPDPLAVSYEIQVGISGTYQFPIFASPVTNTNTFIGLAPGNYVARARAVYGDGTKSPWAFYTTPVTVTAVSGAGLAINAVSASAVGTNVASCSITTTVPNTIIVLEVDIAGTALGPTVSTVTDLAGLTWTKRQAVPYGVAGALSAHERWWAFAATPQAYNITMTGDINTTGSRIAAWAASGVNLSVPFDVNGSLPASATGTTAQSASAVISTTNAKTLLISTLRAPASLGTITRPTGQVSLIASGTATDISEASASATQNSVTEQYSWTGATTQSCMTFDALQGA